MGLETILAQRFVLRSGYKFYHDEERGSLGLGLQQRIEDMVLKLDFAYIMYERLPDTQFISLDLMF